MKNVSQSAVSQSSVSQTDTSQTKDVQTAKPSEAASFRILKVATCPSLSGLAQLEYHVGCDAQSGIHLRIHTSTGNGIFSNEWIALNDIKRTIANAPPDIKLKSPLLQSLYKGKSVNSHGFLFAALIHEGWIDSIPSANQERLYTATELTDPDKYAARMQSMLQSSTPPADQSQITPSKSRSK